MWRCSGRRVGLRSDRAASRSELAGWIRLGAVVSRVVEGLGESAEFSWMRQSRERLSFKLTADHLQREGQDALCELARDALGRRGRETGGSVVAGPPSLSTPRSRLAGHRRVRVVVEAVTARA